jgi:hypothetical protein
MKILTLSGLQWRAWSPSLMELMAPPHVAPERSEGGGQWRVTIAFDSRSWLIALNDVYGLTEFLSRDEAARNVAMALQQAIAESMA